MARNSALKLRLMERGHTITEVARAEQIAITTAAKIIGGKYPLRSVRSKRTRARVLARCAEVLGVDVTELEQELDAAAA